MILSKPHFRRFFVEPLEAAGFCFFASRAVTCIRSVSVSLAYHQWQLDVYVNRIAKQYLYAKDWS